MSALVAYVVSPIEQPLEPASVRRAWMDRSIERFAYRCLPMNIANASGWWLRCAAAVEATWNGAQHKTALCVSGWPAAVSHFGEGVLTFQLSYLFRTPPGVNLWVKGPPNLPKDGIQPLEGIVETDWSPATFTMNWIFTRPGTIRFAAGEPFCFITPLPRGLAASLEPELRDIRQAPFSGEFAAWSSGREAFLARLNAADPATVRQRWQKDYFRGQDAPAHETRVDLAPFADRRG